MALSPTKFVSVCLIFIFWVYHFRWDMIVVDKQNQNNPNYIPMSKDLDKSIAFKTAVDLVISGKEQPSGYTEPLLHYNRLKKKINQN